MQDLLGTTLILLAACSLAVVATAAFRVPALLGYLAVGALLGPSVSGVIAPGEALTFISELGLYAGIPEISVSPAPVPPRAHPGR